MIYDFVSLDTPVHAVKTDTENYNYDTNLTYWCLDINQCMWLQPVYYNIPLRAASIYDWNY